MQRIFSMLSMAALVAALAGCTSSSNSNASQMSKTPRPPISPDLVTFYRTPPAKCDTVGLIKVPVTPELRWDERGDATAGFQILRSKAAAMGANGVLLKVPESEYERQVTAGYMSGGKTDWYTVSLRGKPGEATAVAQAIYVYNQ
jgi:hypothetical protein